MKTAFFTLFIITSVFYNCQASNYTFHTVGSFYNENNWDSYPGSNVSMEDTIFINADCNNLDLTMAGGNIIFGEQADYIGFNKLILTAESKMSILCDSFEIYFNDEGGYIDFTSNHVVFTPNLDYVKIINFAHGIRTHGNNFWEVPYIDYANYGIQDSYLLNMMVGKLHIQGTIKVLNDSFYLQCPTTIHGTSVIGSVPFDFHLVGNGSITQTCPFCIILFSNIDQFAIEAGSVHILGYLILN